MIYDHDWLLILLEYKKSQFNDLVLIYFITIKKHNYFGWAVYPSSQVLLTECVGNHFRPQNNYAYYYYIYVLIK
jgi:hypothetical protein